MKTIFKKDESCAEDPAEIIYIYIYVYPYMYICYLYLLCIYISPFHEATRDAPVPPYSIALKRWLAALRMSMMLLAGSSTVGVIR